MAVGLHAEGKRSARRQVRNLQAACCSNGRRSGKPIRSRLLLCQWPGGFAEALRVCGPGGPSGQGTHPGWPIRSGRPAPPLRWSSSNRRRNRHSKGCRRSAWTLAASGSPAARSSRSTANLKQRNPIDLRRRIPDVGRPGNRPVCPDLTYDLGDRVLSLTRRHTSVQAPAAGQDPGRVLRKLRRGGICYSDSRVIKC